VCRCTGTGSRVFLHLAAQIAVESSDENPCCRERLSAALRCLTASSQTPLKKQFVIELLCRFSKPCLAVHLRIYPSGKQVLLTGSVRPNKRLLASALENEGEITPKLPANFTPALATICTAVDSGHAVELWPVVVVHVRIANHEVTDDDRRPHHFCERFGDQGEVQQVEELIALDQLQDLQRKRQIEFQEVSTS
jgi:hypothetical protein